METTHYVFGRNTEALCDKTTVQIHRDGNLMSGFARDTTCIACKRELAKQAERGLFPRY